MPGKNPDLPVLLTTPLYASFVNFFIYAERFGEEINLLKLFTLLFSNILNSFDNIPTFIKSTS